MSTEEPWGVTGSRANTIAGGVVVNESPHRNRASTSHGLVNTLTAPRPGMVTTRIDLVNPWLRKPSHGVRGEHQWHCQQRAHRTDGQVRSGLRYQTHVIAKRRSVCVPRRTSVGFTTAFLLAKHTVPDIGAANGRHRSATSLPESSPRNLQELL